MADEVKFASALGGSIKKTEVGKSVESYENYHQSHGGKSESRLLNYTDMVNKYYDLATSFYEYGWGESFHFAHRRKNETLRESIRRHEHFLALRLGLKPGMKVLDVGCGIGGPLREIASFSGASVTGLNNNAYQISRGTILNKQAGLSDTCDFVKADFMNIPKEENSYDAVYAIEATCHAPDAKACYGEIFRVLKPGSLFFAYEWCLTEAFVPGKKEDEDIKSGIELGNGLPDIRSTTQCLKALEQAGFQVMEECDLSSTSPVPWYSPLDPSQFSISTFRLTLVGRTITRLLVWFLESIRVAPAGSYRVAQFLETGADALVEGGRKDVFTPLFYFVARKPEKPI